MAESSAQRVAQASVEQSLSELIDRCELLPAPVPLDLHKPGMGVIAEIKLRSPAEGKLQATISDQALITRVQQYVGAGATALSVLTEPTRFDGSLRHLGTVAACAHQRKVPVMRKDFLTSDYQVYEARSAGADGVLLIARMLNDDVLQNMLDAARTLGMFVLLEAFDRADLERCKDFASESVLIGLNCRDLTTLDINPERFAQLIEHFPEGSVKVAESGIYTAEDTAALVQSGYDMVLVGTALMKASDPAQLITEIIDSKTSETN